MIFSTVINFISSNLKAYNLFSNKMQTDFKLCDRELWFSIWMEKITVAKSQKLVIFTIARR